MRLKRSWGKDDANKGFGERVIMNDEIKICRGFVRTNEGSWVNILHIRTFYVGGGEEVGFRICISFEIVDKKLSGFPFSFSTIGNTFSTLEEAQKKLHELIENQCKG
jgi:hypothetical protein